MKMNHDSLHRLTHAHLLAHARPALPLAALAAALLGLASCSSGSSSSATTQTHTAIPGGNFTTTVFLGDSLTAGYQSGSLLDTAEVHGWAPLVAAQASFPIVQALIAPPGAPATLELQSISPLIITTASGTTTGRDNPSTQVTDLAVPGALLNDVLATVPVASPTTGQQQITQLVLGFPGLGLGQAYSQATFAAKANPTTIFLWAGNNDALVADETGMPASMTSLADFTTQYAALISQLTTQTTAHLVIANIPDVTLVPYLTPAALVLAEYSAATGYPTSTLSALLGISPGDFVNPGGLAEITAILQGKQAPPISDAGVLSAAEAVIVQQRVSDFNTVIAAQAKAAGATLVDINTLFDNFAKNGLTINGYTATNTFLGGFFSLDGIHPSNTGYAVVANTFIDAMNAGFGSKIPDVTLSAVAAADPLWPPNLAAAPAARTAKIIALPAAGRSLNQILFPTR
jgi:lysophospholipase L1-like esterase